MALKLVWRGALTWAIEAAAFALLTLGLPGLHVASWQTAWVAVLVLGAMNALIRPLVLLAAVNLGLALFGLISLVLNAALVLLAAAALPGFSVDDLWTAFVVAFGLAILNTIFSGLLGINDDDSFYRNVIRWIERRRVGPSDLDEPGTVLIQIDGLAESVLRSEIDAGGLPTLSRWLTSGSHRLIGWECDVPSMTSSGQAGILYGNNANIPAFRWYEKATGRLLVSNHPRDADLLDRRQATPHALLRQRGSSVGNIFAGGAEHCVATMCRLETESGRITASARDLYDYFVNPYNLYRAIGGMVKELALEYWQSVRQRSKNVEPRMDRGGSYPFVRAVTCVLLRDVTTWTLVADMFAARMVAYADYLGYDEVAHHAGPTTDDARGALRKMDGQLRQLESAALRAPRRYRFVVLSDHGQSSGWTFRQRYGLTLDVLVHQLLDDEHATQLAAGSGEGRGQLNALANDVTRAGGMVGRATRRLLGDAEREALELVDPDAGTQAQGIRQQPPGGAGAPRAAGGGQADVVVCASGNLALVYFAHVAGRLSLEAIAEAHPRLIDGLVAHPGIGFVLLYSDASGGPVVVSAEGRRDLVTDAVVGDDPLANFASHTASFLRRLSTYNDVGDIVVNSLFEPSTGQVAAFEELIGCHGGTGGHQNAPFVLYPADWGEPQEAIVGSEHLHAFLSQHIAPFTSTEAPAPPPPADGPSPRLDLPTPPQREPAA